MRIRNSHQVRVESVNSHHTFGVEVGERGTPSLSNVVHIVVRDSSKSFARRMVRMRGKK
jgi:hypothetical protein